MKMNYDLTLYMCVWFRLKAELVYQIDGSSTSMYINMRVIYLLNRADFRPLHGYIH